jgi:hypothetical protein
VQPRNRTSQESGGSGDQHQRCRDQKMRTPSLRATAIQSHELLRIRFAKNGTARRTSEDLTRARAAACQYQNN